MRRQRQAGLAHRNINRRQIVRERFDALVAGRREIASEKIVATASEGRDADVERDFFAIRSTRWSTLDANHDWIHLFPLRSVVPAELLVGIGFATGHTADR